VSWTGRLASERTVSSRLASLGDPDLVALLDGATPAGSGIGGTTATLTVDGVPVFVKWVPLTDLERRPEHAGSTANLFRLPMFYQYGIGSTGFGAWRELAVHAMTTGWVRQRRFAGFPILYHWRVLPRTPAPMEPAELDRWVTHWEGSPAVRARLTAIGDASASIVLFMERVPYTVDEWLTAQLGAGDGSSAYTMVDRGLREGAAFMNAQGLLHFDAHFHNVLTDGLRLYFADFGLATHSGFDLDATESAFVREHASYDRCYTATHLTRWLVRNLLRIPWEECHAYVRDGAGRGYPDLPAPAAAIVTRHAPVATVLGEFFGALQTTSKLTPYPARALEQAHD
jgi:hypothetical protein